MSRLHPALLAGTLAALAMIPAACTAEEPAAAGGTTSSGAATSGGSTSTTTTTPSAPAGFTPLPTDGAGPIPAGKVGMTANGRPDAPWAVFTVTEDWETIGGWVIGDEKRTIGYWTVDQVYKDPCDQADSADWSAVKHPESILHALRLQDRSRVTDPVRVTVDGYKGISFEVHAPEDLDPTTCPHYRLWGWTTAGERYMQSPGAFDRLYVLDVDGKVVVLTVSASAGTPKSTVDAAARFLETVDFVPRD